jgi:hypothetical protein
MIAVATDMSIPKNMNQVSVEVLDEQGVKQSFDYPIAPNQLGKPMPGTLAVIPPNAGGQTVRVRLIAELDSSTASPTIRVIREAVVKVPTDRVALLPMPLHWLCDGQFVSDNQGGFRACDDPDQTCAAGQCVPAVVSPATLRNYEPALVFGGGDEQGSGGHCIDVPQCFEQSVPLMPSADCSVDLPANADPSSFNVAIELAAGGDGQCTKAPNSRCFVPLDADPAEGYELVAQRVKLQPAVCAAIANGKALGVVTTSLCPTKDASVPVCGPWTNVTTPSTPDSGGAGGTGDSGGASSGAGGSSGSSTQAGSGGLGAGTGKGGSSAGGSSNMAGGTSTGGASSAAGAPSTVEGLCPVGVLGHCDLGASYTQYPGYTLNLVEDFPVPIDLDADPIFTWSDGSPADGQTGFRKEQLSFVNGKLVITADSTCPASTLNSQCYPPRTSYADPDLGSPTGAVGAMGVWSGELRTKYNNYRYGRYEVEFRAPSANPGHELDSATSGDFLSTFFTFRSPKWNTWSEIDFELEPNIPTQVGGNVINVQGRTQYPADANDAWTTAAGALASYKNIESHVYAFTWTPTAVTWYVDNMNIKTFTGGAATAGTFGVPTASAKIMMNLWVFSGTTFGDGANNKFPFSAEYDNFRFYRLDTDTAYPCAPTPSCLLAADKPASAQNNPNEKNYPN